MFARREAEAKRTVAELAEAVRSFQANFGRYPDTLEMLVDRPAEFNRQIGREGGRWPFFKGTRIPLDPWGQKYRYQVPGLYNPESFDVWSVHGHSRNPDLWIGNWEKKLRKE